MYRRGRRSHGDGLLVIRGAGDPGPPQVGIVARRTVGNAVRRNRAKRRLREAIRLVDLRPATAYIVVAAPAVVRMPFDELVDRLAGAVAKTEENVR